MTKTDFSNLSESGQLETLSSRGEVVINFLQGSKNITIYKLTNLFVKVTILNNRLSIDTINESDLSKLFESGV